MSLAMLIGFATQPLHHVDPAWVAAIAVAVLAAFGGVPSETLRSVNWNYALLFGTLASVVRVFAVSGLDQSLASVLSASLGGFAASPLLFVVVLTLVAIGLSFVLRFAAAAPMLTVALSPVAVAVGINAWVVAMVALVGTSGFFLPYQNTTYQVIQQELNGRLFSHSLARPVMLVYGGAVLVAIALSVPVWHLMGLL